MADDGRGGTVNFFISYTGADAEWAKWIAWELERAGYSYRLQAEHFPPGTRFINEMRRWLDNSDHLLAVLSPAYFKSDFASLEAQSALAQDPLGLSRRVIPVRIEPCSLPAIYSDLVYIDFVGKSEQEQRRSLVAGVRAAVLGQQAAKRQVKERPKWPGVSRGGGDATASPPGNAAVRELPVRVQFIACDVGRGLDLRGQHAKMRAAIERSHFAKDITLHADFDVTDANLFAKLNTYGPHVVHISGNQYGGDVLLPSHEGGEVAVSDEVFAGLLSSLGSAVRLVIVDTCKSYRCAKRVSEVVDFAIGVDDDIFDDEAIRFYEVFYTALGAGRSIADAHRQAMSALQIKKVPLKRIPKLCVKPGRQALLAYLVGDGSGTRPRQRKQSPRNRPTPSVARGRGDP